jgi:hypothetical protein
MPASMTAVRLATALCLAAWLFAGPLFAGRVLYYRDVTYTYLPDFVFAERALAQGVWPCWHPGADAGAPFLLAYPLHLVLLATAGARATLAVSPPLHVLLAMAGAYALARRLRTGPRGAALAGAAFALSGPMLGGVLYPVFLGAAWMPLAVERSLALVEAPGRRRLAQLALVLAVQVSTMGIEAVVASALAALVLLERPPGRSRAGWVAGAVLLAAALAAPALLGARALLQDTARGQGFSAHEALGYSASAPVLLEAVVPGFFGDPHGFTDAGYWGQPFFPAGSPFFLSLYCGVAVALLASRAGLRPLGPWVLAAVGALLAAGAHGPLGPVLAHAGLVRHPVKFFVLTALGLALLAGRGLERPASSRATRALLALAPTALLVAALVARAAPSLLAGAVHLVAPAARPGALVDVVATHWPAALARGGALSLGVLLALVAGPRVRPLAGVLAVVELALANGRLNPTADAAFLRLVPQLEREVTRARQEGPYRWFSYGAARSTGLRWDPRLATASDVWLFYVDRQSLLPRANVIDGLDGAFDLDRMGLAPAHAALTLAEADPARFRELHPRLRLAGVRFVLAFDALSADLVSERAAVRLPGPIQPLRLYELREPLPRAYRVEGFELARSAAEARRRAEDPGLDPIRTAVLESTPVLPRDGAAHATGKDEVTYESLDPHTSRVRVRGAAGIVLVLDGAHPDWRAEDERGQPVPLLRAYGRYRAFVTEGGDRAVTMRYVPRWRAPSLALCGAGLLVALVLLLSRSVSEFTGGRHTAC